MITVLFITVIGYFMSLYARGYRFDPKTLKFSPSGLLVTKSSPDGAQVFVNGELKTATNANLSLTPGTYDVSIKKEGYFTWNKRLKIEKEVVTQADAHLFRIAPSLSTVTFSGAEKPVASEDLGKIAYSVPATGENLSEDKEGLWLIETFNLPLGFSREPKRITDGDLKDASWRFSPDGREILLENASGKYLLESGVFTPQAKRINIAATLDKTLEEWEKERAARLKAQLRGLPEKLVEMLTNATESVVFSPDENKILYKAKADFTLANDLIKPIPGSSSQKQEREVKKGRIYVYDIKEDRNFLISDEQITITNYLPNTTSDGQALHWFPTSLHLLLAKPDKVIIMDYDGTNRQEVYSGAYSVPNAFPIAATDRILILTNLGANSSLANLYSLGLK